MTLPGCPRCFHRPGWQSGPVSWDLRPTQRYISPSIVSGVTFGTPTWVPKNWISVFFWAPLLYKMAAANAFQVTRSLR